MRPLSIILVLLLSACATVPVVSTDFDPSANFASYRTYSWRVSDVPRGMNPLMVRRVEVLIEACLAKRGYARVDVGDFAVALSIVEKDRLEVDDYGSYGLWSWSDPWPNERRWSPHSSVEIYQFTERKIAIDMYDAAGRPVWHGEVITDAYSDQVDYEHLRISIDALIAQFPPGAKAAKAPAVSVLAPREVAVEKISESAAFSRQR